MRFTLLISLLLCLVTACTTQQETTVAKPKQTNAPNRDSNPAVEIAEPTVEVISETPKPVQLDLDVSGYPPLKPGETATSLYQKPDAALLKWFDLGEKDGLFYWAYAPIDSSYLFYVSNREPFYMVEATFFDGLYGLADSAGNELLSPEYTAIGPPDLTIPLCLELEQDNRYGLYNYKTKTTLEPQFEWICYLSDDPDIAYGIKDKEWFEIDVPSLTFSKTEFFVPDFIDQARFDAKFLNKKVWLPLNSAEYEMNQALAIWPSWARYFVGQTYSIPELLVTKYKAENSRPSLNEENSIDFSTLKVISKQVTSFIADIYYFSVDVRSRQEQFRYLYSAHEETNTIQSAPIHYIPPYPTACTNRSFEWVSDSLLEVREVVHEDSFSRQDVEELFAYYTIDSIGTISRLHSNRKYDCTKFMDLQDYHFERCQARFAKVTRDGESFNMVRTNRLSIDELDIMRNEIFADYGRKFTTEKWQTYFNQFDWYTPYHETVLDIMSERDKRNVELIQSWKMQLMANDTLNKEEFINFVDLRGAG